MTMQLVTVLADLLGIYSAGRASFIHSVVLFTLIFLLPVHFYYRGKWEDVIAYQVSACIIRARMALTIKR